MTTIKGYCPMGCGETLFVGSGGYVTCSLIGCTNPDAASVILEDSETHHIVKFEEDTFSIQHPLRERLDGDLFQCQLHGYISRLAGPPVSPGRYRARAMADGLFGWERVVL